MKRIYIIFSLLLCLPLLAGAQSFLRADTTYYSKQYYRCDTKAGAIYFSIEAPASLLDYSGVLTMTSFSDHSQTEVVYEKGFPTSFKEYYSSGEVYATGSFKDHKAAGSWIYYYPNGSLKAQKSVLQDYNEYITWLYEEMYLESGETLAQNGNGQYKEYSKDGRLLENGSVLNGQKHLSWTGYTESGDSLYHEEFEQGVFLSGIRLDSPMRYAYTAEFKEAMPKGGMEGFYRQLGKSISYPSKAAKKKISGTSYIRFTVNEKGVPINVETVKAAGHGFDEEAMRVIGLMRWEPGEIHGKKIMVDRILPVKFKIP